MQKIGKKDIPGRQKGEKNEVRGACFEKVSWESLGKDGSVL